MKLNEYATKDINKSNLTLNEDWFDDDNFIVDDTITDEAPEKESPKNEVDTGISNLLIDAIKDEFETIKLYNSIIEQIRAEDRDDIISILQDIVNEENVHVGQLQKALGLYSPNADSIEHGSQEAEEQMKVDHINEGIQNLDRVISGKNIGVNVQIPMDMADAIVAHDDTEKAIDDAMKEVEGSAKEVSDKKETKKVSTPAMKKMKLSEDLFTESSDGWNKELIYYSGLQDTLDSIRNLDYELNNCIKGAYTDCTSYEELGEYVRQLGAELLTNADAVSELTEEDDEFEESLAEGFDYDIYPGEYRLYANRYGNNDTYKADPGHLVLIDTKYLKTDKGLKNYIKQCKKNLKGGYYDEFEIVGPDNDLVFEYPSGDDEFDESLTEGRKPEELSLFDQVYNEISADMDVEARHRKVSNKEFPNKRRFNFDDVVKFTAGAYPEEDAKSKRVDKRNAKIEPKIDRFILDIDGDDQKEFLKKVANIYKLDLEFKGNKAYLEMPEE